MKFPQIQTITMDYPCKHLQESIVFVAPSAETVKTPARSKSKCLIQERSNFRSGVEHFHGIRFAKKMGLSLLLSPLIFDFQQKFSLHRIFWKSPWDPTRLHHTTLAFD